MSKTPREALFFQVEREFMATLGCAEHETVARHILVDLARNNKWEGWLKKSDYNHNGNWTYSFFDGATFFESSFDKWVNFHENHKDRFAVSQEFIERMCEGDIDE